MSALGKQDAAPWTRARFRGCELNRPSRELLRGGVAQALEPRAFVMLEYLIDQRHRVVSRSEVLDDCFGGADVSYGALARTVMKVRNAIGDLHPHAPLIQTVHRVGYRFIGDVELSTDVERRDVPPAEASSPIDPRRVVLLPFTDETLSRSLGWVELGLVSLITKALEANRDVSVVPLRDVVAALGGLTPHSPHEQRIRAVETALGARTIVWGRLTGEPSRLLMHFNIRHQELGELHGMVAGNNLARMATDAATSMRDWIAPTLEADGGAARSRLDLGDAFLNDVFALALQRSRQNRLIEAEHLFDILDDAEVDNPEALAEAANVHVLLGRPGAAAEIESVSRMAILHDNKPMQVLVSWMRGTALEQVGRISDAADALTAAAATAEAAGLSDLAIESLLGAAHYLGGCFDPRAQAVLSRALPAAERLGNRALVSQAYWTAGKLAGFANDWYSAARHHEMAMTIARDMDDALRFAPTSILAWTRLQLGEAAAAYPLAMQAWRNGMSSGRQPELGLTAGTAVHVCLINRRIQDAAGVFRQIDQMSEDQSVAMLLAREVHCKATLLSVAGRYDEALQRVAAVQDAVHRNPVLLGRCHSTRLAILLRARRFDEVEAACSALQQVEPRTVDPRLHPWLERARALAMHLGRGQTELALERMHRLIQATPVCEASGLVTIEAAWMHLERGETDEARRLGAQLGAWLDQTPSGMQLDARLRHAAGDWIGAAQVQRQFIQHYAESVTDFQHSLLRVYEQSTLEQRSVEVPRLDNGLNLQWTIVPAVLAKLPLALGGEQP